MNWFQRHLNWTCVLGYRLALVVFFVVGVLVGNVLIWLTDDPTLGDAAIVVGAIAGIITLLLLTGWLLRQKGRSLWWLLLLPAIVWCLPLWLENKIKKPEPLDS